MCVYIYIYIYTYIHTYVDVHTRARVIMRMTHKRKADYNIGNGCDEECMMEVGYCLEARRSNSLPRSHSVLLCPT